MLNLLMKLLSKFIKPVIIQSHRESLHEIAFTDPENQLDTSKLFIGLVTKSLICKKLEEGDSDVMKLYSSVGDCILCISCFIHSQLVSSSRVTHQGQSI